MNPNTSQLPYLLKLVDDDSPRVRQAILEQLTLFGPLLEQELNKLSSPPSSRQRKQLFALLEEHHRQWLKQRWNEWISLKSDKSKLEAGLALLAEFQRACFLEKPLSTLLDELATDYSNRHPSSDALLLSKFLFEEKTFRGAQENYYHPQNSNLIHVIEKKEGLPISLVCLYILVGKRLGLEIEGCNFPGHFLARAFSGEKVLLIDCFNGGQILDEQNFFLLAQDASQLLQEILQFPVDTEVIIRRVLRNLIHAYQRTNQIENSALIQTLLEET